MPNENRLKTRKKLQINTRVVEIAHFRLVLGGFSDFEFFAAELFTGTFHGAAWRTPPAT